MNNQEELLNKLSKDDNIETIQKYINDVITIRGFSKQPIEQTLLLLMEEVGELAKAVRKEKTNMGYDKKKIYNYDTVESEIADVFIVLTSICNKLGINLYEAIISKEKENVKRTWNNNSAK